ncbi:MAG: hypothetical protein MAG795_00869 [Candidatus Woesearchaeota archaeon]|nr:hypothetical protein [Candidatus Woesearchaeota archaeon]
MNKKANLAYNWGEYVFLGLSIVGFMIAIFTKTLFLNYVTIIICGLLAGRIIYKLRKSVKLTVFFLIMGFLLGYILGSIKSSRKLVFILFIVSCISSFYSHLKGYVKL